MVWFKVCDKVAFGPKHMAAGNEACGAWVRAGAWVSEHLTDGFIPSDVAHAIAPKRVWKKLVEARAGHHLGLVIERDGGYELHDYLAYNPSAAEVQAERAELSEKRREAGRRGAAARWHEQGAEDAIGMAKPMANGMAKPCGAIGKPMAPIPIPIPEDVVGGVARAREAEPEAPEVPPREPQPDFIAMAYYLAQRGDSWGQSLCDRIAEGRSLTKAMRDKLPAAYARAREGEAAAARLAEVKASPPPAGPADASDAELRAWASQRWVEARQKRKLAAQAPDPRLIAELCAIAIDAVVGAKPDAKGWKPTPRQAIGFWVRRYLLERQDKAGGVEDRGHPLAWLPGRCREYPLPRQADLKPADQPAGHPGLVEARPGPPEAQGGAADPPTSQRPPAPGPAPREPEAPPALPPPEVLASFASIGAGGTDVLRPRPSFGRPN